MFCLSALGTLLGVAVAYFALKGAIGQLIPAVAMMTGTYIGGGVNFAAMAAQYDVANTVTAWSIAELTVADNLLMPYISLFCWPFPQSSSSASISRIRI